MLGPIRRTSLVARLVKHLPRNAGDLGFGEDPVEKEKATLPVFWSEEFPGLYSPCGHKESDTLRDFHFHFQPYKIIKLSIRLE